MFILISETESVGAGRSKELLIPPPGVERVGEGENGVVCSETEGVDEEETRKVLVPSPETEGVGEERN